MNGDWDGRAKEGKRLEKELDEEIRFHFETTVAKLVKEGMTPEAAQAEARQRFGDEETYRVQLGRIARSRARRDRLQARLSVVAHSFVQAVRGLRRSPGFTVAVAVTLGLGIGANAMMFGIVDRLLLSPPEHIEDADGIKRLYRMSFRPDGERQFGENFTFPDYGDFHEAGSFSALGGFTSNREITVGEGLVANRAWRTMASASFFELLGVQPILGRFFTEDEDQIGRAGTAVLGYDYWRREFGADPEILGRVLEIGGAPYTVIGVAPSGFTGVELTRVDLWIPLMVGQSESNGTGWIDDRGWYWLRVIGRLSPGTAAETASDEASALHLAGRAELIAQNEYDANARVEAHSVIAGLGPRASNESVVSRWLAGVSIVVLLITCANVTNLLLVRGLRRRREIALRLAMGISRSRLFGQLISETALLAGLGGVFAIFAARWGGDAVRGLLLPDIAWTGSSINGRMVMFTAGIALLVVLLTGLLPAIRSSRQDLVTSLKAVERGGVGQASRVWSGLLMAQASLSVVLLTGAGLFVLSLRAVEGVDLGFDVEELGIIQLQPESRPYTPDERVAIFDRAAEAAALVPGVRSVGVTTSPPFLSSTALNFRAEGVDTLRMPPSGGPYFAGVTPGFFDVMNLRLVRGRALSETDGVGAPRVAVITEGMARGIWPQDEALGRCIYVGNDADAPCRTVVGIVEDVHRQSVVEAAQWMYYLPLDQIHSEEPPRALMLRAEGQVDDQLTRVQRELLARIPELDYAVTTSFAAVLAPDFHAWRLGASMFSLFGILALVVAGVGLYSVLAFTVSLRTHEIGVRGALGASKSRIVRVVMRQALALTGIGVLFGLTVAYSASGFVAPLLYGTSPRNPGVFSLVAVTLLLVGTLAAYLPARRAAAVDPLKALQAD